MEGGAKWRREIYSSNSELESRRGVHRRTGHCPVLLSFFLRSPEFFYFRQLNGRRRLLLHVRAKSEPVSEYAGF